MSSEAAPSFMDIDSLPNILLQAPGDYSDDETPLPPSIIKRRRRSLSRAKRSLPNTTKRLSKESPLLISHGGKPSPTSSSETGESKGSAYSSKRKVSASLKRHISRRRSESEQNKAQDAENTPEPRLTEVSHSFMSRGSDSSGSILSNAYVDMIDLTSPPTSPPTSPEPSPASPMINLESDDVEQLETSGSSPCPVSRSRSRKHFETAAASANQAGPSTEAQNDTGARDSDSNTSLSGDYVRASEVSKFQRYPDDEIHEMARINEAIAERLLNGPFFYEKNPRAGCTYVLSRKESPNFCKIGWGTSVEDRVNAVSNRGRYGAVAFEPHPKHKKIPYAKFCEGIVHLELRNIRYKSHYTAGQPRKSSKSGGVVAQNSVRSPPKEEESRTEWFRINVDRANEVNAKWRDWLHEHKPYDQSGMLKTYWKDRINEAEFDKKHTDLHCRWLDLLNPPPYDKQVYAFKQAARTLVDPSKPLWMKVAISAFLLVMKDAYLKETSHLMGKDHVLQPSWFSIVIYDLLIILLLLRS
ncbi:hypothetical protein AJ79_05938 [Helicocarpus griseus UAMH5409]|uniref:Bacteriophage T5 Orf172 DNA-binding domain-containing protein n=1 Tax=Helicocarpus griseus UAMH5409 TaxID=1447875 RepID=A0A2B7XHQ1_9EURO|nr:hypothetical protein AJ79_05938 [Helicocarpus griseus UAMH5409]